MTDAATPSPPVAAPPATPVAHPNLGAAPQNGWDAWTHAAQPQPQPARPLTGALYVEVRECVHCNHIGINDSDSDLAACNTCGWSGPTPESDHCPGCAATGTMTSACPKCGEQYRFVCDADLAGITAPSTPTPPGDAPCSA